MARRMSIPFGGLNLDRHPNRLADGDADRAINVVGDDLDLSRRQGFAEVEDDVKGDGAAVKNIFAAHFSDGDVYIVCVIGAALYQCRIYNAEGAAATSFSAISTGHTHNANDRGWGFVWDNFFHYGDRGGLSKWCPERNSGTAYKAGLPRPSTGAAIETADSGEKNGHYHVAWAMRNSRTEEEGVISLQQTPALECRNDSNTGGISNSNWATLKALHTDYEWQQAQFYCSLGSTELDPNGAGNADSEKYSYRLFKGALVLKTQVSAPGLNKADSVLRPQDLVTNAGGEPPGSLFGCFDGLQAVYAGVYQSSALVPGRVDFSLPGYPTMVPAPVQYIIGGDSYTLQPRPWAGQVHAGLIGQTVAAVAGGGRILVLTKTSMTELVRQDARLAPVLRSASHGCAGEAAATGSPGGLYVLGYSHLTQVAGNRMTDLARHRVRSLIESIPVAARDDSVVAYYSHAREVWVAVSRSGGTKPQRILVYEEETDRFRTFDIACLGTRATLSTDLTGTHNDLTFTAEAPGAEGNSVAVIYADGGTAGEEEVTVSGTAITVTLDAGTSSAAQVLAAFNKSGDATALATGALKAGNDGTGTVPAMNSSALTGGTADEGITAMCELATPDADPVMLVATDAGRVLKYPSGNDDAGVHYAGHWRGYAGQRRLQATQYLHQAAVSPTSNVADNVRMGHRALRMGDETGRRQYTAILHKDGLLTPQAEQLGPRHGRLFQIELFTPHSVTSRWTVSDLYAVIGKT